MFDVGWNVSSGRDSIVVCRGRTPKIMTLYQVLMGSGRLQLSCLMCATRTSLEASFLARRYGIDACTHVVAKSLVCADCGSTSVVLGVEAT